MSINRIEVVLVDNYSYENLKKSTEKNYEVMAKAYLRRA